jgi:hypothetical protein
MLIVRAIQITTSHRRRTGVVAAAAPQNPRTLGGRRFKWDIVPGTTCLGDTVADIAEGSRYATSLAVFEAKSLPPNCRRGIKALMGTPANVGSLSIE